MLYSDKSSLSQPNNVEVHIPKYTHIKICIKVRPDTSRGVPPMPTSIEVTYKGKLSGSVLYRLSLLIPTPTLELIRLTSATSSL
eukprot:scaffold75372_cov34-Attheya_sp.AAC.2